MSQIWTPQHQVRNFITLHPTLINVVLVRCLNVMSNLRAKHAEGTSVDASHLDAPREGTSPTWQEEIPWVTTPTDVGGLADSLFRVSMGNPQRGTSEGPITNVDHEVNELNVGLWQHLYCLQLDVTMVQDPSRPPPPWHLWTVATIKDMVGMDASNVKDCVILSLGSALLFFSHHQEPQEELYLHEA